MITIMPTLESIKSIRFNGQKLKTLVPRYIAAAGKPQCDKHSLMFGGDERFSIFRCHVILCGYTGYYGSSSCSTFDDVPNELAQRLLNKALNKHMTLILQTMGEIAEEEARPLLEKARQEVDAAQKLLHEVEAGEST